MTEMIIGREKIAACLVFALCLTVSGKVAQTSSDMLPGKFEGKVVDHLGLYILGATIIVTARGFRRQCSSGNDGTYFMQLPPGTYDVRIEQYAFLTFRKRIRIEPGGAAKLNVTLRLKPKYLPRLAIETRRG